MSQVTTADRAAVVAAEAAEAGCSLTCECWDCASYRRHLLRLTAVVLLACWLGGELGWRYGLWRANEAVPVAAAELAGAMAAADASWF